MRDLSPRPRRDPATTTADVRDLSPRPRDHHRGLGRRGRRIQMTDARGITATTGYDVLNRPLVVDDSDATPDVTYAYDLGAYGIGRLYSVSNAHATSLYRYDMMGRVVREDQTIGGLGFSLQTAWNLGFGRPRSATGAGVQTPKASLQHLKPGASPQGAAPGRSATTRSGKPCKGDRNPPGSG